MKKTNPLKIVEIENYANNLRRELDIPSNSPFPVLEVIEKFHGDGLLTIQYLEDDDPLLEEDTPAKYNPSENYIYVKESVLEELENSIHETNERVSIELAVMSEAQKDISLMFARKIKTADEELLKKLKKALLDEEN